MIDLLVRFGMVGGTTHRKASLPTHAVSASHPCRAGKRGPAGAPSSTMADWNQRLLPSG
jgi:hypothetical protein